jgi:hypothetical protein
MDGWMKKDLLEILRDWLRQNRLSEKGKRENGVRQVTLERPPCDAEKQMKYGKSGIPIAGVNTLLPTSMQTAMWLAPSTAPGVNT